MLSQLRSLVDEMELLAERLDAFPEEMMEARPAPDTPSIKEELGSLAADDREVLRSSSPFNGNEAPGATDWNEWKTGDLLSEVQSARRQLVETLEDLPEETWKDDAIKIIHRDTETLRAVSRRFYESNLSGRRDR